MKSPTPLLRVQDLSYRRRHRLLAGQNFTLPTGITAVLSSQHPDPDIPPAQRPRHYTPAGTLLSLLACDRSPTTGTISLAELPYGGKAYRRAVAWLPPRPQTFIGLNAREHVAYCAWLKGVPKRVAWDRSLPVMSRLGLVDVAGDPVNALSPLSQRLLEIARGICHDARILIIDAPELDEADRTTLLDTLTDLEAPLLDVILVHTHSTLEASTFAKNVLLVAPDSVPFAGTLSDFRAAAAGNPHLLRTAAPPPTARGQP